MTREEYYFYNTLRGDLNLVSVLISINKPHTDNIKALKKIIEVRKNKPNCKDPFFKVFIYETKNKGGCGKVIGEFICQSIDEIKPDFMYGYLDYLALDDACLTIEEIQNYGQGKTLYGWNISNLIIYNKPKELSEFSKVGFDKPIPFKRPPQSWAYCKLGV